LIAANGRARSSSAWADKSAIRFNQFVVDLIMGAVELPGEMPSYIKAAGTKTATCSSLWKWEAEEELAIIGLEPREEMPLVYERFWVIYRE
jgi:uncharacterized protein YhfF